MSRACLVCLPVTVHGTQMSTPGSTLNRMAVNTLHRAQNRHLGGRHRRWQQPVRAGHLVFGPVALPAPKRYRRRATGTKNAFAAFAATVAWGAVLSAGAVAAVLLVDLLVWVGHTAW